MCLAREIVARQKGRSKDLPARRPDLPRNEIGAPWGRSRPMNVRRNHAQAAARPPDVPPAWEARAPDRGGADSLPVAAVMTKCRLWPDQVSLWPRCTRDGDRKSVWHHVVPEAHPSFDEREVAHLRLSAVRRKRLYGPSHPEARTRCRSEAAACRPQRRSHRDARARALARSSQFRAGPPDGARCCTRRDAGGAACCGAVLTHRAADGRCMYAHADALRGHHG